MDIIISILNFQIFGDWGVMNPLSIRLYHIIMMFILYKIITKGINK